MLHSWLVLTTFPGKEGSIVYIDCSSRWYQDLKSVSSAGLKKRSFMWLIWFVILHPLHLRQQFTVSAHSSKKVPQMHGLTIQRVSRGRLLTGSHRKEDPYNHHLPVMSKLIGGFTMSGQVPWYAQLIWTGQIPSKSGNPRFHISALIYVRIKGKLRSGEITTTGDEWPLFLFHGFSYNPEDPWNGLFRSSLLVTVSVSCYKSDNHSNNI